MPQNTETKQTENHTPHFVKAIGKTTYFVICHFNETSKETLQDKLKRMILRDIQSSWSFPINPFISCIHKAE